MSRRKVSSDDGRTLFDACTPLQVPEYPKEELTNYTNFISDAKEVSGLIMKINKSLIQKIANGESPNFHLSQFINEMSKSINASVTSYYKLVELETNVKDDGTAKSINISFKKENL